jgi:negative regulator of sigma E activity
MNTEKIDLHYHQQLSALMDGELGADQGRFLLRRLQHDSELTSCWDRWQLYGDALRGQAEAPAPADFAEGIARAIAAEPAAPAAGASLLRTKIARWGGGALAASVAAVALFMARQQVPQDAPAVPIDTIARQAPSPAPPVEPAGARENAAAEATAALAATAAVVASAPLRQPGNAPARGSATRTQQAARSASVARAPERAAASAAAVPVIHAIATAPSETMRVDPFSNITVEPPSARPWPRAVLPQYAPADGGFNADFSRSGGARDFHPFEPRLPSLPPVTLPDAPPAD